MTSKERVLKALNHEEPDRIPFMYRDVPEVRERLKWDLSLNSDNKKDIWGVEYKYTKFNENAGYWNETGHPLKDAIDPKILDDYPWPQLDWWDFTELEKTCDEYEDYAIMTAPGIASPGILQSPIQPLCTPSF